MSWGGNGLTRGVGRCESELVFERGTRRSGNGHPIQLILYLFTAVARFGGTLQFVRGQTLVLGWWRPGQLRPPPTPQTPQPIEPAAPRETIAPAGPNNWELRKRRMGRTWTEKNNNQMPFGCGARDSVRHAE
jgi:hypothetical protein